MKNTTHRVVILKNVNSNLISQAILIIKDSAIESESVLLQEAEKIVEKYMRDNPVPLSVKRKLPVSKIAISGVIFLGMVLALISYLV